ncbi:MAG: hypothetical protein GXP08_01765 [Gammaproteobacteria bacterium]|nr:hypothetical protein [Gammaproteobacteria bacterium]
MMILKKTLNASILASLLLAPMAAWTCDAAGPSAHIGTVQSIDAANKTFTIVDAQSRNAITFVANNEIIEELKGAKGSIMVNYEENNDDTVLKAVGVTF